jgi:hypothetical protein
MVSIMARALSNRPSSRILLVLVCLYAPYAWLVLIDGPWDSYRWLWIKLWLVLPGIPVLLNQAIHQLPDWMRFMIMGAVACGIVALCTFIAARSSRSSIVVSIIIGALSCANSWSAYNMFRF